MRLYLLMLLGPGDWPLMVATMAQVQPGPNSQLLYPACFCGDEKRTGVSTRRHRLCLA